MLYLPRLAFKNPWKHAKVLVAAGTILLSTSVLRAETADSSAPNPSPTPQVVISSEAAPSGTAAPPQSPGKSSQNSEESGTPPVPTPPTTQSTAPSARPATSPLQSQVPPGYILIPVEAAQPNTTYQLIYPPTRRGKLPPGYELPYIKGQPIPPGYHIEYQPRRGLIIGGALTFGIPWTLGLTIAAGNEFKNGSEYLVIPVLGPWLALLSGEADNSCSADKSYNATLCDDKSGLQVTYVLDGLTQLAGATMLISGLTIPKARLVHNSVTVSLMPGRVGRTGYGGTIGGTF